MDESPVGMIFHSLFSMEKWKKNQTTNQEKILYKLRDLYIYIYIFISWYSGILDIDLWSWLLVIVIGMISLHIFKLTSGQYFGTPEK